MYPSSFPGLPGFPGLSFVLSLVLLPACAATQGDTPQGAATRKAKAGATAAGPQQQAPGPQQQKVPFQREVDTLVAALNRTMVKAGDKKGALGDGSCLMTAQVLTAMGKCHRGYTTQDGPVVRLPVNYLFRCRQADGSFQSGEGGKDTVQATQWVLDALRSLDQKRYEEDITAGTDWLTDHGHQVTAFGGMRPSLDALKAAAEAVGRGLVRDKDGRPDLEASVNALLTLVHEQVVHRTLIAKPPVRRRTFSKMQQKALDYLLTQQEDGVFFMHAKIGEGPDAKFIKVPDTGLTGMGLAALQSKPHALRTNDEQKVIDAGLLYLLKQQNREEGPAKGSFGDRIVNYTTCAAVMALSRAKRMQFKEALDLAQRYILAIQNVDHRDYGPGDRDYGSIGYGGDLRGDLSNTQFAIEGLRNTGIDGNHEAFVKALVFLQRTQNLRKVNNFQGKARRSDGSLQDVVPDNDGGAAYYPGNSPAGYKELASGAKMPRSYGSMTYALLKTYILCGLPKEDFRIQAAVKWIEKNWSLDVNPGSDPRLGEKTKYQGLYYYYMVMAQALDTAGIDKLQAPGEQEGETQEIEWRPLLKQKLLSLQTADGSWFNDKNERWWEGQKMVCTVYAMLALERCR